MDRNAICVIRNSPCNILLPLLLMLLFAGTADAQLPTSPRSAMSGFYTMAFTEGAIWNIPDLELEPESGLGFGARFGYNFETDFGFSLGFDVSRVSPNSDVTYDFAHIDMGISRIWGDRFDRFRPFIRPSFAVLLGHSVESNTDLFSNPALNTIKGSGIGGGIGSYYFIDQRFSLQLSYNYSLIWIHTLRLGLDSVLEPDDNVQLHRIALGAIIFF